MKRIIALDPGERRVGVATFVEGKAVEPRDVWARNRELWGRLRRMVMEDDYQLVLVGRARSLDGSLGPQAERAGEFAERARRELAGTACEVELIDETATTLAAEERFPQLNQGMIDAGAAAVILEDYLAEQS